MIQGYSIFRDDRNAYGDRVAFYIQNHIPVKIRVDLMPTEMKVLCLQVHLLYLTPMLIVICYRPPSVNNVYLDKI